MTTAVPFDPKRAVGHDSSESALDLQELHDFAVDVALRAGALIRRKERQQFMRASNRQPSAVKASTSTTTIQVKSSEVDLVTELDVQVEDQIRAEIEHRWPSHEIIAEESFPKNDKTKGKWRRGKGPTWYVDPLDGTMNYTHSLQLHCISIGFSCSHMTDAGLVEDDPLVGVVYASMLGSHGTVWSGARGHGSFLSYPLILPSVSRPQVQHGCSISAMKATSNTEDTTDVENLQSFPAQRLPLVVQTLSSKAPSGILFASEWGKDRRTKPSTCGKKGNLSTKLETFVNLAANDAFQAASTPESVRHVHGFRSVGSSALDMAFVAQGSVDVLWEGGCWEWDVGGGVAILLEAGGLLTDSNPPKSDSSRFWNSHLPRAQLGARRFMAIRACASSEEESALKAQERVAREIWKRASGLDYHREGVLYEVEAEGMEDSEAKSTSSVRTWDDPLRERKRLTREEAEAFQYAKSEPNGDLAGQDDDTFGGRLLDESKDQWSHNAWDHVEPPASYLELINEKLRTQEKTKLTSDQAAPFHALPSSYWDSFYQNHENRFFKDRKWLHLEFPELIKASLADSPHTRILEVGCGAGNTVFPLLEINKNPNLEIFACDYSSEAVNVVKSNNLYKSPSCGRCEASVWDLTSMTVEGKANLPQGIEAHSLDIIVLIFVLSALHPNEWQRAVANVKNLLKEGGIVLVRDYGRYDLPQLRFGKGRLLDHNFYVRGDGTRVYFFQPEEFLDLFHASPVKVAKSSTEIQASPLTSDFDFETLQLAVDRRMLLNRKERKQMFRNWLQAKFRLLPIDSSTIV